MEQILPIVIGVVLNDDGQVLLGKRHQPEIPEIHGKWNLLGGRVEFGESPEVRWLPGQTPTLTARWIYCIYICSSAA
jgi:8-oxo-dGTP pyrophosphatase MutT (NUDIX family)